MSNCPGENAVRIRFGLRNNGDRNPGIIGPKFGVENNCDEAWPGIASKPKCEGIIPGINQIPLIKLWLKLICLTLACCLQLCTP